MNVLSKLLKIVLSVIFLAGCATSTKGKILRNSILAGITGAAYGSTKEEYKATHAALYGASAAALTALASLYIYDPDKEADELKKETETLKAKLDEFQKPILLDQGNSLFKSQLPSSLTKLVRLGEWRHYKLDEWIQDQNNPNIWLRQIEMYEIIPPSNGNQ
ncbi:MAG: hypothetical protein ACXVCP_08465 [Bdellovibrio sp.]